MKYFSLFSGIGGFELGIQKAIPYAQCVGFSETDPYAKSIYQKHFKTHHKTHNHKDYGDVTKINENKLPKFDCLVGGFPCQPFSAAGQRQGFKDTRGTLFFDIVRILKAKRPKVFVLENVRGLLSHDEGRTFGVLIKTLDELRYDVQWQVLNCKHHGTPQDRNRVFIIGYFRTRGESPKKILPIRYPNSTTAELSKQQIITNTIIAKSADGTRSGSYIIESGQAQVTGQAQVIEKTQVIANVNPSSTGTNGKVYDAGAIAPTLTTNKGEGIKVIVYNAERGFRDKQLGKKNGGSGILSRVNGVSYALTKNHANYVIQLTQPGLTQGARIYNPNGIGITLNSKGGGMGVNTGLYLINKRARRLTPIESERLQDFPDNWTQFGKLGEPISDRQRYACIGNAVNTKVVSAIFDKLKPSLVDQQTEQELLIPNIVSFSGGRTSAMMLLKLLEQGKLQQWRGDCVVFNNTSAEHAATYAFISRIKQIAEQQYNIPLFMLEFCTYETKTSRGFVRRMTYKLVNDLPYCKHNNINGYKFKGEVFEESISQSGVLPSNFQRNCTINMKILVTNYFLADWLASKPHIDQQGTHSKTSNISDADVVKKHKMYHGELSDEAIIDKKTFVRTCQTFRAKQCFKDYTKADVNYNNAYLKAKIISSKAKNTNNKDKTTNNKERTTNNKDKTVNSKDKTTNNRIALFGKDAIKYHNYIGIRFDEKHRAIKIRNRIKQAKLNLTRKNKKGGSIKTQPPFEQVKTPMIKAKINKAKVIEFWKDPIRSKYDLDLPFDGLLSNCVHCMLKGKSKNQLIAKNTLELEFGCGHGYVDASTSTLSSPNLSRSPNLPNSPSLSNSSTLPNPPISSTSPSSLAWWIAIERKYSRKVIKSNDNNYTNIGFFGASKDYVYQTWANELTGHNNTEALVKLAEQDSWSMDCNCTD